MLGSFVDKKQYCLSQNINISLTKVSIITWPSLTPRNAVWCCSASAGNFFPPQAWKISHGDGVGGRQVIYDIDTCCPLVANCWNLFIKHRILSIWQYVFAQFASMFLHFFLWGCDRSKRDLYVSETSCKTWWWQVELLHLDQISRYIS